MAYAEPIPEYNETVGLLRKYFECSTPPPGDPAKAAQVLIQIVESKEPALRLPLGRDAVQLIQQNEQAKSVEFEKWLSLSQSTDAEDAGTVFETESGKLFKR